MDVEGGQRNAMWNRVGCPSFIHGERLENLSEEEGRTKAGTVDEKGRRAMRACRCPLMKLAPMLVS